MDGRRERLAPPIGAGRCSPSWFDLHISALVYDLGDEPLAYYPMEDED